MSNAVSLKAWSEGLSPEKNDLLSWSNLIFQRALQVKDAEADPISEYFFTQWMASEKEPNLLANTFERTFSAYGVSFQIRLMNALINEGIIQPINLLDKVKSNGLLQCHLLTLPHVWKAMELHQLRDKLHTTFDTIIRFDRDYPQQQHAVWEALSAFKTPKERSYIFKAVIASSMRREFGLLNDDKAYFDVATFHSTVQKLSECWEVAPAQVMYGLLSVGFDTSGRNYERYKDFIEPYANDIRELIQFSTSPRDERIRQNLPESALPVTMDMVFSFAIASNPDNMFLDRHHLPSAEHDPAAAAALGAAF